MRWLVEEVPGYLPKVADDAKIVLDYILEVFEEVYESLRRYQK